MSGIATAAIVTVGFLLMLSLVIFTAHRLRPKTFRFKATLTRWVSLDLEMHSPEGVSRRDEHSLALNAGELPLVDQDTDSPADGRA
jgi:hypothetical protein